MTRHRHDWRGYWWHPSGLLMDLCPACLAVRDRSTHKIIRHPAFGWTPT